MQHRSHRYLECIPPRVCAKTLDAILNYYWFFVYLWKETKQYIYNYIVGEETENQNSNDNSLNNWLLQILGKDYRFILDILPSIDKLGVKHVKLQSEGDHRIIL